MTNVKNDYFAWLTSQINQRGDKSYFGLFQKLHRKEFVWIIPNDDNRIGDAMDLRREFLGERHYIFQNGVSILEILVALSRRMEFSAGGDAKDWAWQLIQNLELHTMTDPLSLRQSVKIDDILDALVWRTYHWTGQGGFFPLIDCEEDQTKVELWYQMNAYILEHPEP